MPDILKIIRGLAALAVAASPVCAREQDGDPLPPGISKDSASAWKLVWRDEFDGAALDGTKWSHRQLGPREGSVISKDCVTVENGLARIWVKEKDGVLLNGMIGTQKKFEPLYGIIAGRIRFPRQQGQHGSLWMQPAKGEKVPDDPARSGAEIDIIEWFGERWDASTASNLYWPGMRDGKFDMKGNHAGGTKDFKILPKGQLLSDHFHVFSVEWSPQGYVFRMDGHETYRITEGVSQVPQYLILSLFTADWEAPCLDRKKLPNSMDVDWVRVWQPSHKIPAGGPAPDSANHTEPATALPKAHIDDTSEGWRALVEGDFTKVNCPPETFAWKDGVLCVTGKPTGVLRTVNPVTNFEPCDYPTDPLEQKNFAADQPDVPVRLKTSLARQPAAKPQVTTKKPGARNAAAPSLKQSTETRREIFPKFDRDKDGTQSEIEYANKSGPAEP